MRYWPRLLSAFGTRWTAYRLTIPARSFHLQLRKNPRLSPRVSTRPQAASSQGPRRHRLPLRLALHLPSLDFPQQAQILQIIRRERLGDLECVAVDFDFLL